MGSIPQKSADEPLPQSMAGFTSPLNLLAHLHRPKMKLDLVPVLDLLTIGLMISLLFTRFVMVPGVQIDLPDSDLRIPHNGGSVAVLTIGNKGMLYFDGSVYEQASIERAFNQHIRARSGSAGEAVLFVKAQGSMPLESLLKLCEMAQKAGFSQVQIAGEKTREIEEFMPTAPLSDEQEFAPLVL
ncbi:MAG: ExbD/TolR family protein [Lentimonas sp.]